MRALGEHLIVRLPDPRKQSEGGIIFTDLSKQDWTYGRVVGVGGRAACASGDGIGVDIGDVVVFDKLGSKPLDLDPNAPDSGLVLIHHEMLFAALTEQELQERKLPIPA